MLQKQNSKPIKTFTIGFEEAQFNEAEYASSVAQYLGTDHNDVILTSNDALTLIPELARIYSEPFADSSQLPTHHVCMEASKSGLIIALTGDGAD